MSDQMHEMHEHDEMHDHDMAGMPGMEHMDHGTDFRRLFWICLVLTLSLIHISEPTRPY